MKKRNSSNQAVSFILVALVIGFVVGVLWPSEPEVVYVEEDSIVAVINAVSPAVVSIFASNSPANGGSSMGSGFIVSEDGLVVTNRHVVDDPEADYSVVLADGQRFEIAEIEMHAITDLAVLRLLNTTGLPIVKLGDSDLLKAGQQVVAMGADSVSRGVISSKGRSIQAGNQMDVEELFGIIETDAAIGLGDSGGPLINLNGEVVGINTALDTTNGRISFAIPSEEVIRLIKTFN